MYPRGYLTELAATKATLRRRITEHRAGCAENAARVFRPLAWVDLAVDLWRQTPLLGKLAAIPLGFLAARTASRHAGTVRRWLHWSSLIFGALRQFSGR
ncbi:MAG: hypothetical protein HYV95_01385 [Opitutae bacterium]|nr:hypothetical protein [Opitutae bacterium]